MNRKRNRKGFKKLTSLTLAAAASLSTFSSFVPIQATYVSGDAPFINSWLVSGPYDTPVADEIYDSVVPKNPNLAPKAKTSASSATLVSNPTSFLVDGSTRNQWVTEGTENPCWAALEWDSPITVGTMTIARWDDGRHYNQWYDLIFTFADGSESDPYHVQCSGESSANPDVFTPDKPLKNVKSVRVEVDKGRTPYPSITGISEIEVYQYALTSTQAAAAQADEEEETNLALEASATASSVWQTNAYSYPDETDHPSAAQLPEKANDGSLSTEWIAQMHNTLNSPDTWPSWDPTPTYTLNWQNDVTVNRMVLYERHNDAWGPGVSNVRKVEYSLLDADGEVLSTGTIDSFVPDSPNPAEVVLDEPVSGVRTASFVIVYDGVKKDDNVGLGFREVEVYGTKDPLPEPTSTITPELGEPMTEGGQKWEFFDDRLWNRTYDDYQDLHGYYNVRKGVDTRNKYVYAHTYVYSPKEQNVQFRFGTSGAHRLYVNDQAVTGISKPSEVQRDMEKTNIHLKEGWNKILIQIQHTYTEDTNSNGVPIAKDNNVAYLGFYGRITDGSGNEVEGLQYSVSGTDSELTITTRSLSADDQQEDGLGLPENSLPTGYTEWPYVWNESKYKNAPHNLSASAFQFMADGGEPGYTWSISEGSLPEGLSLKEDGTIDGIVESDPGDYTFMVQVKDAAGHVARQEYTLTVKERPNKWFEEGRVSALSHTGPIYQYFVDPEFSVDSWAERASRQGHTMVSVESLQQNYYWPSKFADPAHSRQMYLPKDENGQVVDGLKQFEEAVKRHDMKFGLYYATEGGGLQHYSTDVFVQNVEDLIERYDPAYLYFDGPQAMPNANYDVMYSAVRNYSDDIIIDANAWGTEYGDPDLRTGECSSIYARERGSSLTKRTVMEPWKSLHTKNNYTPYYARRDDYRLVAQEMVSNAGRGMVDNNDQMPIMQRGPNWDKPSVIASTYPIALQEFIDVREQTAAWFAPEGKPERHESTTGTMPYFLNGSNCSCTDDGKGNIDHFENGHGPSWGYATSRDNNIYLHIMAGPDGRTGFSAISNKKSFTVSPVKDNVEKVTWLNEDQEIPFTQNGETLTIDLSGVEEDQVDTIIKVVTDNPERKFQLTDLRIKPEQKSASVLQLNAQGFMTYQALKAHLDSVTYESADSSVAAVSETGEVTPKANGTTTITVTGTQDGVSQSDSVQVTARDGKIYISEDLIEAVLHLNGKESYLQCTRTDDMNISLEGHTESGLISGLDAANVTLHAAEVLTDQGDEYTPVKLVDTDCVHTENGTVSFDASAKGRYFAIWADVELDGQSLTTNRVYTRVEGEEKLSDHATVSAEGTLAGTDPADVLDHRGIEGTGFDGSRWSASASQSSSLTFDLQSLAQVDKVSLLYNAKMESVLNTPKTVVIETSTDGEHWSEAGRTSGPAAGSASYYGYYSDYTIPGVQARYIRVTFPDGANGSRLDVMEVNITGTNLAEKLNRIAVEPEEKGSQSTALKIQGWNALDEELDLSKEAVTVTSEDPDTISVDENNVLHALKKGRVRIRVEVALDGITLSTSLYPSVDDNLNLVFDDYLSSVRLEADASSVTPTDPVEMSLTGYLNTGKAVDLGQAEVTYEFSEGSPLKQLEGSNVIYVTEHPQTAWRGTVTAHVTLNGVTVDSDPVSISVPTANIAGNGHVEVSSVRSRSGAYDGTDEDSRYVGSMAVDGTTGTSWASRQSDHTPWIQVSYDEEKWIEGVVLVDRGHQVNEIGEGLLEFFDARGELVSSQMVKNIKWSGQPDNTVMLDKPVHAASVKFTIDPDQNYYHGGSEHPERGLAEFRILETADIQENRVESIAPWYGKTTAGKLPALPETLSAVLSDLSTQNVSVTWDALNADDFKKAGTVKVEGTVEGTDKKAAAWIQVEEQQQTEEADRSLLLAAIDYARDAQKDPSYEHLNNIVRTAFEQALQNAEEVAADSEASQDEINQAWINLVKAVHMLNFTSDKTGLQEAIREAQAILDAPASWRGDFDALQKALDHAIEIQNSETALDESIQQALDQLHQAIAAMEPVQIDLDYSLLNLLIETAESADLSLYATEGQSEFTAALEQAKALAGTAESQEEIDAAVSELHHCWMALRLKADESLLAQLGEVRVMLMSLDLDALDDTLKMDVQRVTERLDTVLAADEPLQVDALSALDDARAVLEKIDSLEKPEDKKDPAAEQKPEESLKPETGASEPEKSASTSKSVKTAANSGFLAAFSAAGAALLGVLYTRKKRK